MCSWEWLQSGRSEWNQVCIRIIPATRSQPSTVLENEEATGSALKSRTRGHLPGVFRRVLLCLSEAVRGSAALSVVSTSHSQMSNQQLLDGYHTYSHCTLLWKKHEFVRCRYLKNIPILKTLIQIPSFFQCFGSLKTWVRPQTSLSLRGPVCADALARALSSGNAAYLSVADTHLEICVTRVGRMPRSQIPTSTHMYRNLCALSASPSEIEGSE